MQRYLAIRQSVPILALLAALSACGPKAFAVADERCSEPVDTAAVARQFVGKLEKMLRAGRPVGPARVREQLPDEQVSPISTSAPSSEPIDLRDLYATCRKSVVLVGRITMCERCDDWHANIASGFVIGREGVVVTNYHVLAADSGAEAVAVGTWDGRVLAIQKVLAASKSDDLAVIQVDADDLAPLPVAPPAPVGTEILVISHPASHFYTMTTGIISGQFLRKQRRDASTRHEMTITADFAKGSSGGPVLDRTGAVVGIVSSTTPVYYAKERGVGTRVQMVWKYCISSDSLLKLLGKPATEQNVPK
jgi:S1-C subfamily serine protease